MSEQAMMDPAARAREMGGWRAGRPVEDPMKTKKWGFITVKPSEFLVHCRRGLVLPSSGQGATCFKWPWDSIAVVPTSFQRIRFVADQVTREKVGVAITGLAVYRIADPLLAFRVLNFSYPERAQEKLDSTLSEMLMGATRRLVANLDVEECLQKRKGALADELLREIAPVIGGEGRPEDETDRGWGVVLDTIEIQEVRVLSDAVFASMQEPYRAKLDREARQARAEAEKHSALSEAESMREIQHAKISAEADVRARQSEVAHAEAEGKTASAIHLQELGLREEEARVRDVIERRRLEREEAEAEIGVHEVKLQAQSVRDELERAQWQAYLARQQAQAEVEQGIAMKQADVALAEARAEQKRAAARAQILTAERIGAVAEAVGKGVGDVRVTSIGGSGDAFGSIAQAIAGVLDLARGGERNS